MSARLFLTVLVLVAGVVSPAIAQEEARSPLFRGLFGGAAPLPSREHMLDLSASVYAGYVESLNETREDDALRGAWFRGASGSLGYQRLWRDASVGAFVVGGSSYYDQLEKAGQSPWVSRWNTGLFGSFGRQLGRRTRFSAGATTAYSPQYRFGMSGISPGSFGRGGFGAIGGFGIGPDRIESIPGLDYTVANQPTLYTTGQAELTYELSGKSDLEFYYHANQVAFLDDPEDDFNDFYSQTVGGRYRHAINRYVSARAGYGYNRSRYRDDGRSNGNHLIDVGLDGGYGREFQLSKRTTFEFNTRSNLIVLDRFREDEEFDPKARFVAGGTASLAHRWGRSWQGRAQVGRAVGFVDNFAQPVITNRVMATFGGVPTRRIDVLGYATYIFGSVGFDDDARGYETGTALLQSRWAATRNIAVFAQYFFYHYRFEPGVELPGAISRRQDRHGGSVGVTFWLPLL